MMNYTVELSPETYQLIQQEAAMLNATPRSVVESAVHRQYGRSGSTGVSRTESNPDSDGANIVDDADVLPKDLQDELAQLAFLTDDELWIAAETQLGSNLHERMEALLHMQQSLGLDDAEKAEAEELSQRSERVMLIRAKAAVLLKERGHDISELGPNDTSS